MSDQRIELPSWALPLIVAAIAVPIVGGFVLGGPGLGLAVGALALVVLVMVAVRFRPQGPIEPLAGPPGSRVLLVAGVPVDEPSVVEQIVERARVAEAGDGAEVRVLVPAKTSFLDRWASDDGPAREEAQRLLVHALADLGKADVDARASVGDADTVQAVEDELRTYPATEVILATGDPDEDEDGQRAAAELRGRLKVPFHRLVVG